jgi:hypothetical protein
MKVGAIVFAGIGLELAGSAFTEDYPRVGCESVSRGGIAGCSSNGNPFALVIGGSLDIRLSHVISFRSFEVDYLLVGSEPNHSCRTVLWIRIVFVMPQAWTSHFDADRMVSETSGRGGGNAAIAPRLPALELYSLCGNLRHESSRCYL